MEETRGPKLNRRSRFLFDTDALQQGASLSDIFKTKNKEPDNFKEIVDQDDEGIQAFISKELVGNLVESMPFKVMIHLLIVSNAVLIGLQTDKHLSEDYCLLFSVFDQIVLSIFTLEILLKWYYDFWTFWKVGWNVLDFLILAALLVGPQLTFLSSGRILRILRVLRAFRSLRSVSALAGLHIVVQATFRSIPDMANICFLLLIILLVFGVMGVTLFSSTLPENFCDLQTAMYWMFVCVTEDGWTDMLKHFQKQSWVVHVGGSLYLFVAILIGAFVFANLVIAVVVTNLEMSITEIQQEQKAAQENSEATSSDEIHIVPFRQFKKDIDFTKQTPMERADLKHLTVEKFEKYMLVLSALEENLSEYINIKSDLTKMYNIVHQLNVVDDGGEERTVNAEPVLSTLGHLDTVSQFLTQRDIMSNLLDLQTMSTYDNNNAHSIQQMIRSSSQTLQIKAKLK